MDQLMNCQRVRGEGIGEELPSLYQQNQRRCRRCVTTRVVMAAAAERLCLAYNRNHICINRPWTQSFLGFVRRKATTCKSKNSADVEVVKSSFTVAYSNHSNGGNMPRVKVDIELGANRDEHCEPWEVELVGLKDKRQITTVFCGTIQGDFLPIQLMQNLKISFSL